MITTAAATRRGVRSFNADGVAVHQVPGTDVVGAAIVDGIGSSAEIARFADVAAEVAARVGARKSPRIGILAAAELAAAPAAAEISPDGVAVVAVSVPGRDIEIAWTGDARAYGWDGQILRQRSTDQTMGQWLRISGGPAAQIAAPGHDHWVLSTLGRSTIATVRACAIPDPLVILTSDGIHDALPLTTLTELVRQHADTPQELADAITAAVNADEDGYRDDATVALLRTSS